MCGDFFFKCAKFVYFYVMFVGFAGYLMGFKRFLMYVQKCVELLLMHHQKLFISYVVSRSPQGEFFRGKKSLVPRLYQMTNFRIFLLNLFSLFAQCQIRSDDTLILYLNGSVSSRLTPKGDFWVLKMKFSKSMSNFIIFQYF